MGDRQPTDDIRRYHPSQQEQSVLTPSLRLYFSYPERSPDRSRIAGEVSSKLSKYSDHWTNRAVRLWFNNNKKLVVNDQRDMTDTGTEPEARKTSSSADSGKGSSSNESLSALDPNSFIKKQTNALLSLEDEAAWVPFGSARMNDIISSYNSICFGNASPKLYCSSNSSNSIVFPPTPPQIFPFAIVDLLNHQDQKEKSIWKSQTQRYKSLPLTEADCLVNGYGAYIGNVKGKRSLNFAGNPEFSQDWKNVPLSINDTITSLTISESGDAAWAIAGNMVVKIVLENSNQVMSIIPDKDFVGTHIATGSNFIAFTSSNHSALYFTNGTMSIFPVKLELDTPGIVNLCIQGDKIVCSLGRNTASFLFDKSGKVIRPFIGHRAQVTNISKISDNVFCTCSEDFSIKMWDVREPRCVATFYAGEALPTTITSTSNYIVAGYSDCKLRTYDIRHKQAKAFLGVDINRQLPSTISFNEKLDALSMFSTAIPEEAGYWKSSPDLNNRFAVISPFIRL